MPEALPGMLHPCSPSGEGPATMLAGTWGEGKGRVGVFFPGNSCADLGLCGQNEQERTSTVQERRLARAFASHCIWHTVEAPSVSGVNCSEEDSQGINAARTAPRRHHTAARPVLELAPGRFRTRPAGISPLSKVFWPAECAWNGPHHCQHRGYQTRS